ncbi:MAG: DNA polymerase III subunit alpha [Dehalococcoidia bacterium]|nr:DNA polymerase III subunit alpha [Dehalococcoidia bacterium]
MTLPPYVELHTHSCWSLREGASKPVELLARAGELGYDALALTDHDGLYGSMEFAQAAEIAGIQPITGAELTMSDGSHLTVLAETVTGYRNLCRLLSLAHRPDRENPRTDRETFFGHSQGLIVLSGCREGEIARLLDGGAARAAEAIAGDYHDRLGAENFFLEIQHHGVFGDKQRIAALRRLAERTGIPLVAANNVHYHVRERHRLQDVLVAIRNRRTLDSSHEVRRANSEFFLKAPATMARRFNSTPEAVANTRRIAERCRAFNLTKDLPYELPSFPVPDGTTMDTHLRGICERAFKDKFGAKVSDSHRTEARRRLERELMLIERHGLAGFFLVYWELLRLAGEVAHELHGRPLGLRPDEYPVARGRGSSVASIVCYLIGLSHIDPVQTNLFLDRFLNEELHSLPDIDLDFPRDIRDELLKRVPDHFGTEHAALVAAFPTYRFRNAVRDVGKVLGLPEPLLGRLAKLGGSLYAGAEAIAEGMRQIPELQPLAATPAWRHLVDLALQLEGMPRHLSQHSGGVVIASEPLSSIVPTVPAAMAGRVLCQWDKDSIDDARMVKIDFLALGMLSAVDECLAMVEETHGHRPDLGRIDHDDPAIYASIKEGDTIGLFQIESRAQIQSLPLTQPANLDDLATQVAIIRPGPIMAGAFRPYMEYRSRRARGEYVAIDYGHPQLAEPLADILGPTLGHVLYQDQVLQVAMALADFTAGEADKLRRAMSRKRSEAAMEELKDGFVAGAVARGYCREAIDIAWSRLAAFAAFGFPKSHAVAFALLAYESAWLRQKYPAAYYAALINAHPMGFYSVETLCNDARQHGLEVHLPEINESREGAWPAEDGFGLGLRQVTRLGGDWRTRRTSTAARIAAERQANGAYSSLHDLMRRTVLNQDEAEALIRADALRSFGLSRRELLWQLGLLVPRTGMQAPLALPVEQDMVTLPPLDGWEAELWDFETLGLSSSHPMALVRPLLHEGVVTSRHVGGPRNPNRLPHGTRVRVAGMVVCRQRPVTASGLLFMSLEDEWGMTNAVVFKPLQDRYRELVFGTPFLIVDGHVDNEKGGLPHIIAERFYRCPLPSGQAPIPRSHDFA